tara:strand:- start:150 stop:506 length:357 start_codon:yes stop_codon:yes gene_type:complete
MTLFQHEPNTSRRQCSIATASGAITPAPGAFPQAPKRRLFRSCRAAIPIAGAARAGFQRAGNKWRFVAVFFVFRVALLPQVTPVAKSSQRALTAPTPAGMNCSPTISKRSFKIKTPAR